MKINRKSEYYIVILNFFRLAIVQAVNLILPLITIPYIIRIVGIENVGLIAFATSIVNYFGVFINYGFNLTATKMIAQNLNNHQALNKIFCNVTYSKALLSFLSLVIFSLLFLFVNFLSENIFIYIFLFFSAIFTNMSPEWFFQGVQELKFITRVNLILKFFATISTFLLINKPSDFYYLAIIPFCSALLLFFITQTYIRRKYKLRYSTISIKEIMKELYVSRYIFLSQVKITFFNNFNIVVLGFLTDNKIVGIFSSADKIIKVFSSIQAPIVTSLFPHFASKVRESKRKSFLEINKIALYGSLVYGFFLIILFIFAAYISKIMFGMYIDEIALLIRIMCFIPLLIFINNLYGTQYLINTSNEKRFLINLIVAACINVVLIFPLTLYFKEIGTSISVLITEAFVLFAMYYSAKKIYKKAVNEI